MRHDPQGRIQGGGKGTVPSLELRAFTLLKILNSRVKKIKINSLLFAEDCYVDQSHHDRSPNEKSM